MNNCRRTRVAHALLCLAIGAGWQAAAATLSVDFESVADSSSVGDAYGARYVHFAGATGLTAGYTLNETDFAPGGGVMAAGGNGAPIIATFDVPVSGVSVYVAYATSVTIAAFDANNVQLGTVSTGTPTGISAKGRFSVTGNAVRRLTITGVDDKGFIVDDLSYQTSDTTPTFTGASLASQTVTSGGTASFVVVASGSPVPTLQWQVSTNGGGAWTNVSNGGVYAGATAATLTLTGTTAAMSGYQYRCVATSAAGTATSNAVTLTVLPSSYLSNLSVRASMAARQTLIVGFVVDGGAKPILVRAGGPALTSSFNLPGAADPKLELYNSSGALVTSNDNWDASLTGTFTAVGAFPYAPGSKDAALLQSVNGGHSAQATATGAGLVLVEIYDAGANDSRKLTNLSSRFQVGTGDNVLIVGFILAGTGTRQVLVRGIGPKLVDFNVPGFLADPQIAVYDGGTVIASNDDWSSSLAPTFVSLGAFGLNPGSKDAALVITLTAGKSYTVQVSGVGGTTGEALAEIYLLPP